MLNKQTEKEAQMDRSKEKRFYTFWFSNVMRYKVYALCLLVLSFFSAYFPRHVDLQLTKMIDSIQANNGGAFDIMTFATFVMYKMMHHGVYFIYHLTRLKYQPTITRNTMEFFYATLVKRSISAFEDENAGETARKLLDFQWGLSTCFRSGFYIAKGVFFLGLSLYYIGRIKGFFVWTLVIFTVVYVPVMFALLKKQFNLENHFSNVRQRATGMLTDSITNVFRVKVVGGVDYEKKRWIHPLIQQWFSADYRASRFHAFYVDLFDTAATTLMFGIQLFFLVVFVNKGSITSGQFVFVVLSTLQVHREMMDLVDKIALNLIPDIALMRTSYDVIDDQLSTPHSDDDINATYPIKGALVYQNVSCAYQHGNGDAKDVLYNINVTIPYGQRVGLVGPSGSGKSTFIKCFLRYFDLESGTITANGVAIDSIHDQSFYRHLSVVPQNPLLFHRTIYENLILANPMATDQDIKVACIKACVHDEIMALPLGYESSVGERGESISGGQRQRLALACAFLRQGKFFVCDEGTSALDSVMQNQVNDAISSFLNETGATALIVAHRLSALSHVDRLLVFDEGRIVEDGDHDTLLAKNGLYTQLWNHQ